MSTKKKKKKASNERVVINIHDGSVTDLNGCLIVELTDMVAEDELWLDWLDYSSDDDAIKFAKKYGKPIRIIGGEWSVE
jgi:uncharacterized protein YueI